jgi:hypothetical protein
MPRRCGAPLSWFDPPLSVHLVPLIRPDPPLREPAKTMHQSPAVQRAEHATHRVRDAPGGISDGAGPGRHRAGGAEHGELNGGEGTHHDAAPWTDRDPVATASSNAAHFPIEMELSPLFQRAHVENAMPARSHTCVIVRPATFAAISMSCGVGNGSMGGTIGASRNASQACSREKIA